MTTEFTKKDADEFMGALTELKSICVKNKDETDDLKEMKEKIITKLDALEEKNQKASTQIAEQANKEREFKERIEDLERQISRLPAQNGNKFYKDTEEFKKFEEICRKGRPDGTIEGKSYLRTNVDPDGGYLVPQDLSRELLKNIIEISPVRAYARVMTTSGRSLQIPLRTTIPTSYPTAQGIAPSSNSIASYDLFEIPLNKITTPTAASIEMLQDSAWNMEDQIRQDIELSIAQQEGYQFVNGSAASSEAAGFIVDTNVTSVDSVSGTAGTICFDDLLNLTNIKVGYKLAYAFNRATRINLQTKKDNIGDYLWQPSIAGSAQMTFNGLPYIIMQDMPDIATDAYPVICGDFYQGYTIADKVGMIMIRDDVTQAQQGIVVFTFIRRVGGKVVKPECFLKAKVL
jgi:HK97 family phage major capsid protein